jgi:hypothetical protein
MKGNSMTQKTAWKKSSYSGGAGEACVETRKGLVGAAVAEVDIADSKDPKRSTVITVTPAAWSAFASFVAQS